VRFTVFIETKQAAVVVDATDAKEALEIARQHAMLNSCLRFKHTVYGPSGCLNLQEIGWVE
jgi:hypothetical protein